MKKNKAANIIFLACAALFCLAVLAGTLMGLRKDTSYYENRSLAAMPEFSASSLADGSFASGAESFLKDRAVGRTTLMMLKTAAQLELLRLPVVNSIAITDDALLPFHGYVNLDDTDIRGMAETSAGKIADFNDYVNSTGATFYYLGIPCQYYEYAASYPAYMDSRRDFIERIHSEFSAAMEKSGVEFVDMDELWGEGATQYYFGSDHHYNFHGAFSAYGELMARVNAVSGLGLDVLGDGDVIMREWPNPFMGSRNRELYGMCYMSETLVTPELARPVDFKRWDNGLEAESYICMLPVNDTDITTYAAYMGGDWGETIIDTGRPELPDCLIFGDSFTNAVETLVYASFNVTRSVDMRFYTGGMTLREYIAEYEPDVVICVRDDTVYLASDGNGALD